MVSSSSTNGAIAPDRIIEERLPGRNPKSQSIYKPKLKAIAVLDIIIHGDRQIIAGN